MSTIVLALLGYLIGSISFAVVMSRIFGLPDPRTYGSKNPGATNVLRSGRKAAAALTLLGDGAKGWVAVALATAFAPAPAEQAIAATAVAVFLGHLYPVFFRFQGGKGVATALGVLLGLSPWLGLAVLATWLLAAFLWRTSSLSALIASAAAPLFAGVLFGMHLYTMTVVLLSALLIWRHRSNIRNLLAGREGRIGQSEQPREAASK